MSTGVLLTGGRWRIGTGDERSILDETDGVYTVEAEVFGKGTDMWIRSQGELGEAISR